MQIEITRAQLDRGLLIIHCPNPWELRQAMQALEKPGTYEIQPAKKTRSTEANAYMWALCAEIAEATRMDKDDVYRNAIRRSGIYRDFPPLDPGSASTLRTAWEKLGTGWITEQVDYGMDGETVIIRCYYGSSTYNTKQMSRLIDDLAQDARDLGLETYEDEKIRTMMEEYEREYERIRCKA